MIRSLALLVWSSVCLSSTIVCAQSAPVDDAAAAQAKRETALAEMLSGATLEGSFTVTGPGHDATKLSREKYTLGEVKKLDGKLWLIPTRIQYGGKDAQLPITLPIEWAGDTPVVVVDNLGLPGFGTVSARVMFFADHYAGYWQHGDAGGHLFGTIHHAKAAHLGKAAAAAAGESAD
ncbi:MAG: hypothetical protein WD971_10755 [Pirellulales bacterium]